jgi:hypothetical protein
MPGLKMWIRTSPFIDHVTERIEVSIYPQNIVLSVCSAQLRGAKQTLKTILG